MSRLSQDNTYITEEHDDNWGSLEISIEQKQDKVLIIDYDSLLHTCLYSGKDELGNKNPEYTEDDLELLFGKLTEQTLKLINTVESKFNILACYSFIKGKNNFRKLIYPEYKAHRPPPNPLINKLYEYAKVAHSVIESYGAEADDYVYTVSKKIDHTGIIASIDKDLKQIPGIHYNYNKNIWCKVTEKEGLFNLYTQFVVGDTTDGIKGAKGVGISWVNKNMNIDMSKEQLGEAVFQAYVKSTKGDLELAKTEMELNKQLLTLKYME
tara:strand:+ start:3440 stop:4240 length:801 start_codon:yes stop_codon:yes gene_type:complete